MPRRALTAGFVQQSADQRRLAVVDMADDDDAQQRAGGAVRHRQGRLRDNHVHGSALWYFAQR
jgi:hypothetical protein